MVCKFQNASISLHKLNDVSIRCRLVWSTGDMQWNISSCRDVPLCYNVPSINSTIICIIFERKRYLQIRRKNQIPVIPYLTTYYDYFSFYRIILAAFFDSDGGIIEWLRCCTSRNGWQNDVSMLWKPDFISELLTKYSQLLLKL